MELAFETEINKRRIRSVMLKIFFTSKAETFISGDLILICENKQENQLPGVLFVTLLYGGECFTGN